jgi:glycerol-3-phosphate O-acyltransferase
MKDLDLFTEPVRSLLLEFFTKYREAVVQNGHSPELAEKNFQDLFREAHAALKIPYPFGVYHEKVESPFNYLTFGKEFIRPLIQWDRSHLLGKESLKQIQAALAKGENVILFANHQIEPDPQVLLLFLEKEFPKIAERLIFVAGHRVTQDPLSVPFSKGCNLLCIYSKNYIDHPPEKKEEKVLHNQRAIRKVGELLSEGGKCIYVAPSGGRDRPNEKGELLPSRFDSQSIEMFRFVAAHAEKKSHFYPLALYTFPLLPPPAKIEKELGERRVAFASPCTLSFGKEINFDAIGEHVTNRKERREIACQKIFEEVLKLYLDILK